MARDLEVHDSAVLDFLLILADDERQGRVQAVEHYAARFPGHESAIEHAYRRRMEPETNVHASSERRIGPYRVVRELGRGGQGAVYLAEDERHRRRVALKVLDSFAAWRSPERVERLRREAAVVARLQHPAICALLDSDLEGDPPYMAMHLVEGCTLAHCINADPVAGDARTSLRCRPRQRRELEQLLTFFERVARALHVAHEAGVVHRDVKPGNIMVTPEGEPVLLDFGLARESDSTHETLTHSGQLFGTPAYMAPERIKSEGVAIDRRSDVYSLGVTMFEALTLARPFEGADPEALFRSIARDEVPDATRLNNTVPLELQIVLATAMEKDRAARYATALEIAEELQRVREFQPIRARPTSAARKLWRWSQRHPVLAISVLLVFSFLSIGLGVSQHLLGQRERARRQMEGLSLGTLALTLVDDDPTRALLLAIESAELERDYYSDTALYAALAECREAKTVELSNDPGRSTDLSPDSRWLAMGGNSATVLLEELAAGGRRFELAGHTNSVHCVRFSSDGASLVSASGDGQALVWDVASAAVRATLTGHRDAVRTAEFSPDDRSIATASVDGTARIWRASDGALLHELRGHTGVITGGHFGADGTLLLTYSGIPLLSECLGRGASDHSARLWNTADGRELALWDDHGGPVVDAQFDAAGARVATVSEDGAIRVFTLARREPLHVRQRGHPLRCVAWAGPARLFVGENSGVGVWDFDTDTFVELEGHLPRPVNALAASPDGTRVVSGSSDVTARIWDVATLACVGVFKRADGRIIDCRWSRDGRHVSTATWSNHTHVWYADDPPGVRTLARGGAAITDLSFAETAPRIAATSTDGRLRTWRIEEDSASIELDLQLASALVGVRFDAFGRRLLAVASDARTFVVEPSGSIRAELSGHSATVRGASFDASGERALSWSDDGTARIWNALDGSHVLTLDFSAGRVIDAAWSPDGSRIGVCTSALAVFVASAGRGAIEHQLGPFQHNDPSSEPACFVAFSPDGRTLATTGQDNKTRLLDIDSGAVREVTHSAIPGKLSYSRDGARLLVATRWNPVAYLVDPLRGEQLSVCGDRYFGAHRSSYAACELSPDGNTILTASNDRSVRLWNASDGTRRSRVPDHASAVTRASFSPDGRHFATADAGGWIRIWPVDPLPDALARKPRELTPTERARYRDL